MALDVYSLTVEGELCDEYVYCVLHYQSDVANAVNPLQHAGFMVEEARLQWATAWVNCLPTNYALKNMTGRRVNNNGGPNYWPAGGFIDVGARGGAAGDSAVGPVVLMPFKGTHPSTHFPGGKWETGRIFLPGICALDLVNNQLQPALIVVIDILTAALATPLVRGGRTFTHGVYSPTTPAFFVPNAYVTSLKVGLQNGRQKVVKRN